MQSRTSSFISISTFLALNQTLTLTSPTWNITPLTMVPVWTLSEVLVGLVDATSLVQDLTFAVVVFIKLSKLSHNVALTLSLQPKKEGFSGLGAL